MGPNAQTEIGQRLVSEEPMAININLAISKVCLSLSYPGGYRPGADGALPRLKAFQEPNVRLLFTRSRLRAQSDHALAPWTVGQPHLPRYVPH